MDMDMDMYYIVDTISCMDKSKVETVSYIS